MRQPPSVSVLTHSGLGWRAVQAVLHGLAAAALSAWALLSLESPAVPTWVLGAAVIASAAAAGFWGWRRSRDEALTLAWTGEIWRLGEQEVPAPQVMVDLGGWMLLKAVPGSANRLGVPRRGRWLAASQALSPDAWHRFRAAVYSAASTAASGLSSEQLPL